MSEFPNISYKLKLNEKKNACTNLILCPIFENFIIELCSVCNNLEVVGVCIKLNLKETEVNIGRIFFDKIQKKTILPLRL